MVSACIFKLKDRNGSSRAAILNQLKLDYSKEIGSNEANIHTNLKIALKKGLAEGVLRMAKESGKGSGSFKLGGQNSLPCDPTAIFISLYYQQLLVRWGLLFESF